MGCQAEQGYVRVAGHDGAEPVSAICSGCYRPKLLKTIGPVIVRMIVITFCLWLAKFPQLVSATGLAPVEYDLAFYANDVANRIRMSRIIDKILAMVRWF